MTPPAAYLLLASLAALLTACSSETSRAKENLAFLESHDGTPRELCHAASKIVEAAAAARNAGEYKRAQISQQAACSTVEVFPQYADMPGGVPKASDEEIANQLAALNDTEAR